MGQLSARRRPQPGEPVPTQCPTQLQLWQEFIGDNIMVHRPLVQLAKLIFPNTSDDERSYNYLQQICEYRRNRMVDGTMNSLYMLKVLGIKPKDIDKYDDAIALMEA